MFTKTKSRIIMTNSDFFEISKWDLELQIQTQLFYVLTFGSMVFGFLSIVPVSKQREKIFQKSLISQQLCPRINEIWIPSIVYNFYLLCWYYSKMNTLDTKNILICSFQKGSKIQWGVSFWCLVFSKDIDKNIGISFSTSSITSCHGHFIVWHWKVFPSSPSSQKTISQ